MAKKRQCVIVGAGTYGEVYSEYLKEEYDIVGFIDDDKEVIGKIVNGHKVLGDFNYLLETLDKSIAVFVPIGSNRIRVNLLTQLTDSGFSTPSFIHPKADLHPSVKVGKGVYILPATSVMPFTVIDDFVMISMGVNIAHHTVIKKGAFMSQGTNIGASLILEENAYIGIAATIMTGVKRVGKNSLVGAGAVIIKDVPDGVTVVGNPGRIL